MVEYRARGLLRPDTWRCIKRGYYPKGGGEAILEILPIKKIYPLIINEDQKFKDIHGIIHISNLPEHIAKRMKQTSIKKIFQNNFNNSIRIDSFNSLSSGTGITLWSQSKDTILGKTNIGERGITAPGRGRF